MDYDALFALVFASQVVVLSGVCPARVQALGRRVAAGEAQCGSVRRDDAAAVLHRRLLFPAAVDPGVAGCEMGVVAAAGRALSEEQRQSARLFDFVSPVAVVIALVMAGGYAAFLASRLSGADGAQILKLGIFLLTQSSFAFVILSSFRALRQDASPVSGTRHQSLTVAAPLLVFASIMISAYYFGKEGLAAVELPQLRPIMMSAFLQLVGVLVFSSLYQKGAAQRR